MLWMVEKKGRAWSGETGKLMMFVSGRFIWRLPHPTLSVHRSWLWCPRKIQLPQLFFFLM
jgi:hypothetical protein